MTLQTTHVGSASSIILVIIGESIHWLTVAQPWLASLSYVAAIGVGIITIYYKYKNKR